MTFEEIEIPADMVDEVAEYREHLLESVADYDETLWRSILKILSQSTKMKLLLRLRAATIDLAFVPMMCGSAFKNKGVQTCTDYVMEFFLHLWIERHHWN